MYIVTGLLQFFSQAKSINSHTVYIYTYIYIYIYPVQDNIVSFPLDRLHGSGAKFNAGFKIRPNL